MIKSYDEYIDGINKVIDRLLLSLLIALIVGVIGTLSYVDYDLDHASLSPCIDWLCQLAEAKYGN